MYSYVLTSMKRQKSRSILVVLVNFVLAVLLNLYFGLIGSYQTQLHDLAVNTPIKCTITNPDGTMEVGISVSSEILRGLQAAEQIRDLDCSVQMKAGFGEFAIEDWKEHLNLIVSAVNKSDSSVLPEEMEIQYLDGWDETVFTGSERVCVLRKTEMDKQGYVCGEEFLLTVYYFYYNEKDELWCGELPPVSFIIVGQIDDSDPVTSYEYPDVLLPFQTAWDLVEENQADFTADAVSFYVKDPLALNAFKEEMGQIGELGLMEIYKGDNVRFSYKGTALYVQDGTFITMADRLKTAIRILTAFLLPMGILVFIVGYVISHLLANGRVKEFALFRSLGMKAPLAVWVFWCEQFVLVLAGNVLGCLAALLVEQQGFQEIMTVCGAAFGGYMLGTTVALALLAKEKALALLTTE
ncbi:MAG: hypothetical protein K2M70_09995 [Lachnospiraceae bacterium]|nr:hypothetical protein [Lachnospiraceae bacterium]